MTLTSLWRRSAFPLICAVSLRLSAQTPPGDPAPVLLPAFTIEANQEAGYVATNSIGATKISTELNKLPVSMDVLTEQLIKDFGQTELFGIAALSPSVGTAQRAASGDVQSFSIRGFTTFFTARNGSVSFRNLDSANVARTEVVNGPASVLYGQIDPGGIINVVTKQPSATRQSNLRLDVGSWNYFRAELGSAGPLSSGKRVTYRVDASLLDRDGYRDFEGQRKEFIAPAVRWNIGPRTYVQLDGEYLDMSLISASNWPRTIERQIPVIGFADYIPRSFNAQGPGLETFVESYLHTAVVEHAFNDRIVFRNESGVMRRESDAWEAGATQGVGALGTLSRSISGEVASSRAFSNRANLAGRFDFSSRHYIRLVGGWEYVSTTSDARTRGTFGTLLPAPAPWILRDPSTWNRTVPDRAGGIESARNRQRSWADEYYLLSQVSLFSESLLFLGGVRHSDVHVIADNLRAGSRTSDSKRSRTSPQAGLMWRTAGGLGFYANYSESFRQIYTLRTNEDRSQSPFDPLIAKGLDAGVKYDLFGGRVSGALGAFEINYENARQSFQASDALGNYTYELQNGESRARGVEFRVAANVSKQLQLVGGYTYVDARVSKNPSNPGIVGRILPRTPYHTAQLTATYRLAGGRLKGLELGGTIRGYSRSKAFETNDPFFIDPAVIVNLRAAYTLRVFRKPTRLNLLVTNVTDEFYFPSSLGPGDPVGFRLSLEQRF